jgi:DNA repair exonuclease SbcCD ATPase subunit
MITIKKLRWSNLFSYGEDNEIDFSANALTQIVGKNGHGKSSIALILEEALYNKNSKGIKKADILNRNSSAKSYSIDLEFNKDGVDYRIKTNRGNTQTVKLYKEDVDISAHTATNTYKLIEELIGYDHKTFAQIVYQSSAASLEFLTATDSNRKKFLIDLLSLSRYVEAAEIFKAATKEVNEQVTVYSTKAASAETWIAKYTKTPLVEKPFKVVPDLPTEYIQEVTEAKENIKDIEALNKKVIQNNKYKELRDAINLEPAGIKPESTKLLDTALIEHNSTVKNADAFILKMKKLGASCPTCLQDIDADKVATIISDQTAVKLAAQKSAESISTKIAALEAALADWEKKNTSKELYEEYHGLYNPELTEELLNKDDLQALITQHEATITQVNKAIKDATEHNNAALAHNAKVELVKTQMQEMQDELEAHLAGLAEVSSRLSTLQVLVKTFSSTGLVAYKIECLIKDLEETTNKYLAELSSGRFQISFKIAASDKLNVVITDNGKDIDIIALSGGERARVNAAALLGIRKLMQSLSNSRINLLILDETIENLDTEGKEKLVEVLLAEEHLNTFVISHGFSHPLLEKIQVIKTKNVSRIE